MDIYLKMENHEVICGKFDSFGFCISYNLKGSVATNLTSSN